VVEENLPTPLFTKAFDHLASLLVGSAVDKRDEYILLCVNNLKAGKAVPQSVVLLQRMLGNCTTIGDGETSHLVFFLQILLPRSASRLG